MTTYNAEMLTKSEVSAMTGFCYNFVWQLAKSGKVQIVRVGKMELFKRDSLLLYLRDNYPNKLKMILCGEDESNEGNRRLRARKA